MNQQRPLSLELEDGVFVLELVNADADNVLNLDVLGEWHSALDQVQAHVGNGALLIHCNHPKTFSTGIDLAWLFQQQQETILQFIEELENLLLRLAILDLPTVVAINGNCYAGGALIASACDFRYMRADRGRFCFPEVKIEKAFTPVMIEVAQLLPDARAVYELSVTAEAWGGEQCYQRGIVDQAVAADALFEVAMEKARGLAALHRPTYVNHKRALRKTVMELAASRGLA